METRRERKQKGRERRPVQARPRLPAALAFRIFVLGGVSIAASSYAIYRHYFVPRPPMVVPAPPATEVPAPELEPAPTRP